MISSTLKKRNKKYSFFYYYDNQLQDDYDEMKAEMPRLQLEEADLELDVSTTTPFKQSRMVWPDSATIVVICAHTNTHTHAQFYTPLSHMHIFTYALVSPHVHFNNL